MRRMKRKPLNRVSKKRAAQDRLTKPAEDEYRETYTTCQICERRPATELHHIARGTSGRRLSKGKRPCLLHLCGDCHRDCGDYSQWPPEKQAARKLISDPHGFDLDVLNACRVARIDAGDVLKELRELLAER